MNIYIYLFIFLFVLCPTPRTSTAQGLFKAGPDTGLQPTRIKQNLKIPSVRWHSPNGDASDVRKQNNKQFYIYTFIRSERLCSVINCLPLSWNSILGMTVNCILR